MKANAHIYIHTHTQAVISGKKSLCVQGWHSRAHLSLLCTRAGYVLEPTHPVGLLSMCEQRSKCVIVLSLVLDELVGLEFVMLNILPSVINNCGLSSVKTKLGVD